MAVRSRIRPEEISREQTSPCSASALNHAWRALTPAAHAEINEPVKLAIGVDAAYVAIYPSKQNKLCVNVELFSSRKVATPSMRSWPGRCP
jgi:hypothetical protein